MLVLLISIAIPCYKSSKTIGKVVDEIRTVFKEHPEHDYQIVLVNDYPHDSTFSVIKELCDGDDKITGINLSKNFGQSAAKLAAVPYTKGDVVVFMDDDGQHPAEGIFPLVDKINEGYDVVYAHFKQKKHSFFKRVTSKINAKIAEMNGTRIKGVHVSSFYAISRFAADAYENYDSPFPSVMGYLNTVVDKVTDIEMPHRPRMEGQSNYSFKKLLKLWLTGFTNFSVMPLRFIAGLGGFTALFGFILGFVMIIRKLIRPHLAAGYTSTIAVILFIGGIILIALGLIGEYIGRIYMTVSNLQPSRIRQVYQGKKKEDK